jgi:hypothetical protein
VLQLRDRFRQAVDASLHEGDGSLLGHAPPSRLGTPADADSRPVTAPAPEGSVPVPAPRRPQRFLGGVYVGPVEYGLAEGAYEQGGGAGGGAGGDEALERGGEEDDDMLPEPAVEVQPPRPDSAASGGPDDSYDGEPAPACASPRAGDEEAAPEPDADAPHARFVAPDAPTAAVLRAAYAALATRANAPPRELHRTATGALSGRTVPLPGQAPSSAPAHQSVWATAATGLASVGLGLGPASLSTPCAPLANFGIAF